jgi:hypothetical protein
VSLLSLVSLLSCFAALQALQALHCVVVVVVVVSSLLAEQGLSPVQLDTCEVVVTSSAKATGMRVALDNVVKRAATAKEVLFMISFLEYE